MVILRKASPRPGKPQRDANLREHPVRKHAAERQSVAPAIQRGVQTSATPQKQSNEIDDHRASTKTLGTTDCDLPLSGRSVTDGLDVGICKIEDVAYLTVAGERGPLKALMRACGTEESDFFSGLLQQIANAVSSGKYPDEAAIKFMLAFIKGADPRDQIEAVLVAQMAASHTATMRSANRLANSETPQEQESAQHAFNKLARTFAAQVEALQRYRAGREERVIVQQNVSVTDGGQAIVGNVTQPRPKLKKHAAVTPALADSRRRPMKIINERQRAPDPLSRGQKKCPICATPGRCSRARAAGPGHVQANRVCRRRSAARAAAACTAARRELARLKAIKTH